MHPLKQLIILCLAAALTGCVLPPVKYDADEQEKVYRVFQLQQEELTYWQMNARFAVRVDNKSHSGNIRWVNNGQSYAIKFSGPMDQGSVIITGDRTGVTLKDSQGYEGTASTPEAMLSRYTQYEMPVSRLKYWVIGLPTPNGIPSVKLSPQGYPLEMIDGEWRIEYQYFRDVNKYLLPRKIIIHHPSMKLTLSVYDWKTSEKPYAK
jgi:outer membrane lipoprotein LolB